MGNKSFDEDFNRSFDYYNSADDGKKADDSGLDSLVSSMRSDVPLITDTEPARKSILERINLKLLVGILLGLFIVALLLFMLAGQGRPALEHSLALLFHSNPTATQTPEPTLVPATPTPLKPTSTPQPTQTIRPTSTATRASTPTQQLAEATATSSSTCRDALSITLADVGQTMCVKGTLIETVERPNAFMVIFSNEPGAFYWASYDMVWSQAKPNTCYQVTGTIQKLANSPILLFNYSNVPEVCP